MKQKDFTEFVIRRSIPIAVDEEIEAIGMTSWAASQMLTNRMADSAKMKEKSWQMNGLRVSSPAHNNCEKQFRVQRED